MIDRPEATALIISAVSLLSQVVEPTALPNVPGVVSSMTSTGVLIWYLWYSTTRIIPGHAERFSADLEKQREVLSKLSDKFSTNLEELRESFERALKMQRDHYDRELATMREIHAPRTERAVQLRKDRQEEQSQNLTEKGE